MGGEQMDIIITNKAIMYDWDTDEKMTPNQKLISRNRKNGYITKDSSGREIGIAFMADDKRKHSYKMSNMLFFKESNLGQWRIIKTPCKEYIPFAKLETIVKTQDNFDNCQIKI